jgi:Fe-S oxidoreductase
MHVRIDFDLLSSEGRANFRHFIEAAADLVVSFGGSLSGEHGDGQARSELLGRMYPSSIIEAFAAFKAVFDPENRLNPGNIIDPRPLDENLRVRIPVRKIEGRPHLALHADHGDLEVGARRCVGVGKCRRLDGGAMCPSFQVTRNERDSTRGRARLLSEMFGGDLLSKGWRSREVLDALDLCLGCKACASDCPVGVDVARYKVEFLSHYYEHHLRPRAHYALGQLPAILRSSHRFAAIANLLIHSPLAPLLKWLAGIDQRRSLPQLATRTLQDLDRPEPKGPTVILWPDTFSNYLAPEVGAAAIEVLEHLGATVALPRDPLCCGLTWFSTGQIEEARKVVASSLLSLLAMGTDDVPIVVLEPSCASMLREELSELFPGEVRAEAIAQRIRSFGELVAELIQDGATLELSQSNRRYLAQVHCHQRATVGYAPESELLSLLSVLPIDLEESCCGLAGNFGFEAGHFEISQKIAERGILHRMHREIDELGAETPVVVADGFSCRTQIEELSGVRPRHLAEILRDAIRLGGMVASDANARNGG